MQRNVEPTPVGSGDDDNNAEAQIILVDEHDRPVGCCAKLAAHEHGGQLHRAFSVFVFNDKGEMLLQRRALSKYHFGGLWTNACCSHPARGQDTAAAAADRLEFEFGFRTPIAEAFSFVYRAEDRGGSGLTEHEFDHVFVGRFDGTPRPNPQEIDGWRWVSSDDLACDVREHPERYTPWFKIALDRVLAHRADVPSSPAAE